MAPKRSAGGAGRGPARAKTQDDAPQVSGLRTLGDSGAKRRKPLAEAPPEELVVKARETLRAEFDKALELQRKLRAESDAGAAEKGRDARTRDKLRSIVASLEGMNRFALAMGLVTPAQARELYADAMKQGLYEGWS